MGLAASCLNHDAERLMCVAEGGRVLPGAVRRLSLQLRPDGPHHAMFIVSLPVIRNLGLVLAAGWLARAPTAATVGPTTACPTMACPRGQRAPALTLTHS